MAVGFWDEINVTQRHSRRVSLVVELSRFAEDCQLRSPRRWDLYPLAWTVRCAGPSTAHLHPDELAGGLSRSPVTASVTHRTLSVRASGVLPKRVAVPRSVDTVAGLRLPLS